MGKKKPKSELKGKSKQELKTLRKRLSVDEKLIDDTERFATDLICAREMFKTIVPILRKLDDERRKKIEKNKEYLDHAVRKRGKKRPAFDFVKLALNIKSIVDEVRRLKRSDRFFRCNSIILLVSKYDEFLSRLLNSVLRANPDQLKSSEKTLSYGDIFGIKSVSEIINKFVNKEIEKVIRSSHEEQLEYIDNRLKLGLKEFFSSWDSFIEITERRNLYAHTGGNINSQYIITCKQHNIKISPELKEGSFLDVTDEYFESAYRCIFELGVRLGQSVLRRLFPKELKKADSLLNDRIGVDLLEHDEQWEVAKSIFDIALGMPPKLISNDNYHKLFIINSCICLKQLGQKKEMQELLNKIDWSSADSKFHLALYVLKEKYVEAEKSMSSMNGRVPIDEYQFRTWPIFREFRETKYFARAFKKIYNKDYVPKIPEDIISGGASQS